MAGLKRLPATWWLQQAKCWSGMLRKQTPSASGTGTRSTVSRATAAGSVTSSETITLVARAGFGKKNNSLCRQAKANNLRNGKRRTGVEGMHGSR
eukprot:14326-Eustigmatos_ZCMA.PRE.1